MDNPEPNPNIQNLRNQYISLLIKDGFSESEASVLTNARFAKWQNLRKLNPDKLSWIMNTKNLTDENIYIYMICLVTKNRNILKFDNFQKYL